MTILNTYNYIAGTELTQTWLYLIPVFFFILTIVSVLRDWSTFLFATIFFTTAISGIIAVCGSIVPITETRYDCIIDNSTSIKEVYESGYEIVEVNGEIYTFKDREVEE